MGKGNISTLKYGRFRRELVCAKMETFACTETLFICYKLVFMQPAILCLFIIKRHKDKKVRAGDLVRAGAFPLSEYGTTLTQARFINKAVKD